MIKNILITGKPGCGKSTLIGSLIEKLEKDHRIAGIITPEIRKGKGRVGFRIIDLASGEEDILASVNIKSEFRVSKYSVNVNGIDKITEKFMGGFEKSEVFVVDEIGKMEMFSEKFKHALERILDSEKPVIATITLSKHPFIEKIKGREDSKIFYLERGNEKVSKEIETTINRIF